MEWGIGGGVTQLRPVQDLRSTKMSLPEHFARMRPVYAELLGEIRVEEYADATEILKTPLSSALYSAYIDLHTQKSSAIVDLVGFLGGYFIYDSQGAYDDALASRVVGAFGASQEPLSLSHLLARLREQRDSGASTKKTLELIDYLLFAEADTAPLHRQRTLYHAMATALEVQSRGVRHIFEDIATRSNYFSRLSYLAAKQLRALSKVIHDSVKPQIPMPLPKQDEFLSDSYWSILRELIDIADRDMTSEAKAQLADQLVAFHQTVAAELMGQLRDPTDQLLERISRYVSPLVDKGEARPRNYASQRWRRMKNPTQHAYDLGHFLPHSAGGPKDINLFIQDRGLNRGWSAQGRRYRWVESLASSNPGTFYFVRPVYEDLSPIPRYLEWGVLLEPATAKRLEGDIESLPNSWLIDSGSQRPSLSWFITVFENFPLEVHQDLVKAAAY